jgi:malate dehydrogenase (oxaloacetate-decarboxylating)
MVKKDFDKLSLAHHKRLLGKISIASKAEVKTMEDLATYYTPGVAAVSREIAKNECKVWEYTARPNLVAVISDGSAVLGLGNIGPAAAHPVMAGKALLFKEFANIDAFPIVIDTQDTQEIIKTVKYLAPSFGGINLEDISAPRCFEIEESLQDLGIPVMHDDQHGTAVVVLAGLINAVKVLKKDLAKCKVVINGAGAAGSAVALMISRYTKGKVQLALIDKEGMVCTRGDLDEYKKALCSEVNHQKMHESLDKAIVGADIFIGVSVGNVVTKKMIESMAKDPIVFAMANPTPEIDPRLAKEAGAAIVATGRSDYPNQVNNILAFPGIFRGALDAKATKITREMLLAASLALAGAVKNPTRDKILPTPLEKHVAKVVAKAVKAKALEQKVTRPVCR